MSNLKCDIVSARNAHAVKHENSISSHMNDFLNKINDLRVATIKSNLEMTLWKFHRDNTGSFLRKGI